MVIIAPIPVDGWNGAQVATLQRFQAVCMGRATIVSASPDDGKLQG